MKLHEASKAQIRLNKTSNFSYNTKKNKFDEFLIKKIINNLLKNKKEKDNSEKEVKRNLDLKKLAKKNMNNIRKIKSFNKKEFKSPVSIISKGIGDFYKKLKRM